jgi:hypothetical protein
MMQPSKGSHARQSDGFGHMGRTEARIELLGRDNQHGSELLGKML